MTHYTSLSEQDRIALREAIRADSHSIEIMFGRIKSWRLVVMLDDRRAHTVYLAIFLFYLKE